MPLHVVDGIGSAIGMIRRPLPVVKAALNLAKDAGCGDSDYQRYDDAITGAANDWLRTNGPTHEKRWVLFVSLVCPHFPLIARPEWYELYPESEVPRPALYDQAERPTHPFVAAMREFLIYDQGFDEQKLRRAIAAYFGLVSFVDHNVGRLLATLNDTGLAADTRVIYTSDHGDNLGTRGLWGKSTMYEELAGVPMIMAGPEIPESVVCREPVSLLDCFPTILDCVGVPKHANDGDLPGASLFDIVRGAAPRRTVMTEYHAGGAATGAFMIRKGSYKYVYYVGMPPQLFDLDDDPQETRDLGQNPATSASSRIARPRCDASSIRKPPTDRPLQIKSDVSRSLAEATPYFPEEASLSRLFPGPRQSIWAWNNRSRLDRKASEPKPFTPP